MQCLMQKTLIAEKVVNYRVDTKVKELNNGYLLVKFMNKILYCKMTLQCKKFIQEGQVWQ